MEEQTAAALANVSGALRAAGCMATKDIVKVTVYMADIAQKAAFEVAYTKWAGDAKPAR
jgi:enamine deaminase RidA (YjgF/YER057c/UK114 family)